MRLTTPPLARTNTAATLLALWCLVCLTCLIYPGALAHAETISSQGQQGSPDQNTTRSDPYGRRPKVVKPSPPPPTPLIVVPVNPNQHLQQPQNSRYPRHSEQ